MKFTQHRSLDAGLPPIEEDLAVRMEALFERCPALYGFTVQDCSAPDELTLADLGIFADAGFEAVRIDGWTDSPSRVVEGIEFRRVTVTAIKSTRCACVHRGQMVIYRGPYAEVRDDENRVYPRGERVEVCEHTFRRLAAGPCKDDFIALAAPPCSSRRAPR